MDRERALLSAAVADVAATSSKWIHFAETAKKELFWCFYCSWRHTLGCARTILTGNNSSSSNSTSTFFLYLLPFAIAEAKSAMRNWLSFVIWLLLLLLLVVMVTAQAFTTPRRSSCWWRCWCWCSVLQWKCWAELPPSVSSTLPKMLARSSIGRK